MGVELVIEETMCDLGNFGNLKCLFECLKQILDRPAMALATCGMCFTLSKCRMFMQNWISVNPSLVLVCTVMKCGQFCCMVARHILPVENVRL